ncbi:MAG: UDP-N-acetylmuramate dehydrogenase [bacterium]
MAAQPAYSADAVTPLALALRGAGYAGRLREDASFAGLTTYRLGGPIELLVLPDQLTDFPHIGSMLTTAGCPLFFLGGGTNLLASSRQFDGLVVQLGPGFNRIVRQGDRLTIGGATQTAHLLKACITEQMGGLEMLAGVPGTLGGAVAMNAGTMKDWLERSVIEVVALRPDWTVVRLTPAECGFRYRGSRLLDERWRVLEATFAVTPGVDSGPHVREHLAMRRRTQPGGRNAGSNFKNPPGGSAGALIDQAGCKGWREGGAVVSELHANFIQAEVGCTPEDVYTLMQRVARQVEQIHGIRLDPEVACLNFPTPWSATWDPAVAS